MNTVNPDNFNETLDGYVDYAIDFINPILKEEKFTDEQIHRIVELIENGIHWAKDDMTMEDARKYKRKTL